MFRILIRTEKSSVKHAPFTLQQIFDKFDHGKTLFNIEEDLGTQRPVVEEQTSFPSRIPTRLGRAPIIDTIQQMQRMQEPDTPIIPLNTPTEMQSTSAGDDNDISLEEYNEQVPPFEEVDKDVKYEM